MAGFPALGSFAGLEADEPYAGIQRRSFSSEGATVTSYEFEPGARFPLHRHAQEQITIVDRGDVEFTVDGAAQPLREGDWSIVPGDVEHGLLAGPSGARILAIIVPRRHAPDDMALVDGA
jgi:quercetin dioxygenase-like cupin family protein